MPPTHHTEAEEAAFMQDLLAGIGDSIFNAVPSPEQPRKRVQSPKLYRSPVNCLLKTPRKESNSPVTTPRSTRSPCRLKKTEAEEVATLLEGSENWDWDDILLDAMTPKKKSPRKVKVSQQ
jgi:DNA replication ATP-dependent helicase Dna2